MDCVEAAPLGLAKSNQPCHQIVVCLQNENVAALCFCRRNCNHEIATGRICKNTVGIVGELLVLADIQGTNQSRVIAGANTQEDSHLLHPAKLPPQARMCCAKLSFADHVTAHLRGTYKGKQWELLPSDSSSRLNRPYRQRQFQTRQAFPCQAQDL